MNDKNSMFKRENMFIFNDEDLKGKELTTTFKECENSVSLSKGKILIKGNTANTNETVTLDFDNSIDNEIGDLMQTIYSYQDKCGKINRILVNKKMLNCLNIWSKHKDVCNNKHVESTEGHIAKIEGVEVVLDEYQKEEVKVEFKQGGITKVVKLYDVPEMFCVEPPQQEKIEDKNIKCPSCNTLIRDEIDEDLNIRIIKGDIIELKKTDNEVCIKCKCSDCGVVFNKTIHKQL